MNKRAILAFAPALLLAAAVPAQAAFPGTNGVGSTAPTAAGAREVLDGISAFTGARAARDAA